MSKRVLGTPKFEAKKIFDSINCGNIFQYFLKDANPPDGISKNDYLTELINEFYKLRKEFYILKMEERKRLLGLPQEIIYYYYEFPDGQVFEGRIGYGTLERRDKDHRTCCISPVYDHLKKISRYKTKIID